MLVFCTVCALVLRYSCHFINSAYNVTKTIYSIQEPVDNGRLNLYLFSRRGCLLFAVVQMFGPRVLLIDFGEFRVDKVEPRPWSAAAECTCQTTNDEQGCAWAQKRRARLLMGAKPCARGCKAAAYPYAPPVVRHCLSPTATVVLLESLCRIRRPVLEAVLLRQCKVRRIHGAYFGTARRLYSDSGWRSDVTSQSACTEADKLDLCSTRWALSICPI